MKVCGNISIVSINHALLWGKIINRLVNRIYFKVIACHSYSPLNIGCIMMQIYKSYIYVMEFSVGLNGLQKRYINILGTHSHRCQPSLNSRDSPGFGASVPCHARKWTSTSIVLEFHEFLGKHWHSRLKKGHWTSSKYRNDFELLQMRLDIKLGRF